MFQSIAALRTFINQFISSNGRRAITGAKMNTALNGMIDLLPAGQIYAQDNPQPEAITANQPNTLWLRPFVGKLTLIDKDGKGHDLGFYNYADRPLTRMAVFDNGLNGLREVMLNRGIPGSSVARLFQMMKEDAITLLMQITPNQTWFVPADQTGRAVELGKFMTQILYTYTNYYDPQIAIGSLIPLSNLPMHDELFLEQPQLIQPGGAFEGVNGRKLLAKCIMEPAMAFDNYTQSPGFETTESLPLVEMPGDRSAAAALMASWFDRIASAIS